MAQPSYAIKFLGTIRIEANAEITTASILATFTGATCCVLVTDKVGDFVNVGIDGYPMVHFQDRTEQFIETGQTFRFASACTLAIGIYKAVT